ncbi:MAG: hypothetical protein EZS28_016673 [Streblomastix strix]|uniref:Uncharacterized protein n=1 Tax=Streblomastix strix TaxID=222440 RepID=A0A5J4VZ21_9EUKA|nr:MAG: hypothetical protein EZS28_016673 [Streblomastix strix]
MKDSLSGLTKKVQKFIFNVQLYNEDAVDYGANFESKIVGGDKKVAQWVARTLCKVLSTIQGPIGMIHPAIGSALGEGANLSGAVDRLVNKR